MQTFQNQTAAPGGRTVRRAALVALALALAVAAGSAGGAAATAADENATGGGEPRVVDASIHEVDDGQHVLVAVVETDDGTETVVTELEGSASGNGTAAGGDSDAADLELPAAAVENLELSNASDGELEISNASVGDVDLSSAPNGTVAADELQFDGSGAGGSASPNATAGTSGSSGPISGGFLDDPVVSVPDGLRSPPERFARAVSSEPAFGGGRLLPGLLAALGGGMATLGVGAFGIWRRTI